MYFSTGIDPEVEQLYKIECGVQDVYRPKFLAMSHRRGEVILGDELCTQAEMRKTAFYHHILRRADLRLWCAIATVQTVSRVENISLYHPWNTKGPGLPALEAVRRMTPHINGAFRVGEKMSRLEGLNHDLFTALDSSDCAMILIDHRMRCSFINVNAKRILDQNDGLSYVKQRLIASNPNEAATLAEMIRRSVRHELDSGSFGGGTVQISRKQGPTLKVRVASFPSRRRDRSSNYAAIVLIENSKRIRQLPLQVLTRSYGLTPAETRLAGLVVEGRSLSAIAALNKLSKETIRSQIKSIFHKTGVRRQAELVAFLASLPNEMS